MAPTKLAKKTSKTKKEQTNETVLPPVPSAPVVDPLAALTQQAAALEARIRELTTLVTTTQPVAAAPPPIPAAVEQKQPGRPVGSRVHRGVYFSPEQAAAMEAAGIAPWADVTPPVIGASQNVGPIPTAPVVGQAPVPAVGVTGAGPFDRLSWRDLPSAVKLKEAIRRLDYWCNRTMDEQGRLTWTRKDTGQKVVYLPNDPRAFAKVGFHLLTAAGFPKEEANFYNRETAAIAKAAGIKPGFGRANGLTQDQNRALADRLATSFVNDVQSGTL